MPQEKKDRFWIDRFIHKHECFGYDATRSLKVRTAAGVSATLLVPAYVPSMRPVKTSIDGDMMYVVGQWRHEWFDKDRLGAFVIARRYEGDTFATVVWHETYPWALEKLGLIKERKRKPSKPKPAQASKTKKSKS